MFAILVDSSIHNSGPLTLKDLSVKCLSSGERNLQGRCFRVLLVSNLLVIYYSDDGQNQAKCNLDVTHTDYSVDTSKDKTPYCASAVTIGELDGSNQGMVAILNATFRSECELTAKEMSPPYRFI